MNKKIKQNNIQQNENINIDNNLKELYYNNNNNASNNLKKNFNIDISEISNDLLKEKNNSSSMNYSSLISYEQIEPNNAIRISEEIKFIKYLYYRCTNLNPPNPAKIQSLSNFIKLSDEEKIGILTNLNDGEPENKKIYNKLINILKEKRLDDENSVNNSGNNFGDNFISDYEEEDKNKKGKQANILFKKKKIIK